MLNVTEPFDPKTSLLYQDIERMVIEDSMIKVAKNLILQGCDDKLIVSATQLSIDSIKKIRKSLLMV